MCNHLYARTFTQSQVPSFLRSFVRSLFHSFVRSFGGGRGPGAAALRTKYAELALGGPSPKKKIEFLNVLGVFKISWLFGRFLTVFLRFGRKKKGGFGYKWLHTRLKALHLHQYRDTLAAQ